MIHDYLELLDAVRLLLNSGRLEASEVSVDRAAYTRLEDLHYEQVCRWLEDPEGGCPDEIDLRELVEES